MSVASSARRIRPLRRSDTGVTLVEMSVTVLVLGMLVATLAIMVSAGQRVSAGVKERMNQTNSATIAIT